MGSEEAHYPDHQNSDDTTESHTDYAQDSIEPAGKYQYLEFLSFIMTSK